jgi:hypothetical protein
MNYFSTAKRSRGDSISKKENADVSTPLNPLEFTAYTSAYIQVQPGRSPIS